MASVDSVVVRIPADLIGKAKVWAEHDATSVEQFVLRAVEQVIAARHDAAYLAERAARGS
jgi:hypothetical protein